MQRTVCGRERGTDEVPIAQLHETLRGRDHGGSGMVRGKVALITGAGTGIGKGIALAFGQQGANVVVHYNTSAPGAADVAAQIRGYGSHAMICQADLREESAIQSMFQLVVDQFGRIDILVNNSGVTLARSFLDLSVEDWDLVHGINLRGMFLCSQGGATVQHSVFPPSWRQFLNNA